jgi:hypothetical protein
MPKTCNEGLTSLGNIYLKNQMQVDKYLGLYKDATEPLATATLATITEVTVAFGYARIKLNNNEWTEDVSIKGQFTNLLKTFTASGGSFGSVTGYFICTTASGTTGKLLSVEHFNTPHVISDGLSEDITPTIIYE